MSDHIGDANKMIGHRINDGGPAFARDSHMDKEIGLYVQQQGMSLRDYFAAAALTGIISSPYREDWSIHQIIDASLEAADEMLKARKAKP